MRKTKIHKLIEEIMPGLNKAAAKADKEWHRKEYEKFIAYIQKETLEWLLANASGGGSWRRVAIQEIGKLDKMQYE